MDLPQFSKFPQEIQDMVWTATIPAHQPTAHSVKLKTTVLPFGEYVGNRDTVVTLHRRHDTEDTPGGQEDTLNAMATLSAVNRGSNATAKCISNAMGTEITRLRTSIPSVDNAPVPRIRIDVGADLVVLGPE